ncbi:META domain-containing protein [uncultured Devosia sp.]|uniref:META domain-containing protein n=1 Tax=uncultured Devosia sp. TaxID=211434 RepID=UPI0035CB42D0
MSIHRFWRGFALVTALLLSSATAHAAEQVTFTGQVTYRERIALPPGADLTVTLVSLAAKGAPHRVGATALISTRGQVPLQFVLDVRSDALSEDLEYGLVAEIRAGGLALFRNPTPVPVDPAAPLPVLIMVSFDPMTAPAPPTAIGELEVTAALFDTIWAVRTIAGQPVMEATAVSLSIAPDYRAGGNGGCNSYFTEARFDGPALRFGPIAGTRMACDVGVMQQEAAFFAALASVTGYELTDQALSLRDAHGKQLVGLARQ